MIGKGRRWGGNGRGAGPKTTKKEAREETTMEEAGGVDEARVGFTVPEILLRFRKRLLDSCNIAHVDGLLDDLRHENILTDSEVESINEAKFTARGKIRELCNIVRKKGDRACNVLLQKLDETLCTNLGITDEVHSEEEHDRQPNEKAKPDCAPPTRQQILLQTLQSMRREKFIEFKENLKDEEFLERYGYKPMTTADLEGRRQVAVTGLLIRHYTKEKALRVASLVLDAIDEKDLAKQLREREENDEGREKGGDTKKQCPEREEKSVYIAVLNTKTMDGNSARTLILNALKGLVSEQFKEFKDYLSDQALQTSHVKPIPRGQLENKDRIDIANLLISHYTEQEALKVTYMVLKAKNFEDEALQFASVAFPLPPRGSRRS